MLQPSIAIDKLQGLQLKLFASLSAGLFALLAKTCPTVQSFLIELVIISPSTLRNWSEIISSTSPSQLWINDVKFLFQFGHDCITTCSSMLRHYCAEDLTWNLKQSTSGKGGSASSLCTTKLDITSESRVQPYATGHAHSWVLHWGFCGKIVELKVCCQQVVGAMSFAVLLVWCDLVSTAPYLHRCSMNEGFWHTACDSPISTVPPCIKYSTHKLLRIISWQALQSHVTTAA